MRYLVAAVSLLIVANTATAQDLAAKVDALFAPLLAAELVPGVAVGVIAGDTTLVRGYGHVAFGAAAAPDGDTLYEIGSVSKVFTGLLLADAVERGLCRLDDRAQSLLPDDVQMPRWSDGDAPVLLWQLATHTSGLPRLPDMTGADPNDPYRHFDVQHLFAVLPQATLVTAPGATYAYSNLGAGLLGELMVRANRARDYEALLHDRITGPLHMDATSLAIPAERRTRLAPPYDADGQPAHTWELAALAGAGGIRSTVHDMLAFARLQLAPGDGELARAVKLSQQKRHDGANGIALALGWHFARDGVTRWHNGQTGGYHAWFAVVPDKGLAVVALTNASSREVEQPAERVLQHLFGMQVEPPQFETPVAIPRAQLQRLVGHYDLDAEHALAITLRNEQLFVEPTGEAAMRLHARSATEFFARAAPATIKFELDGDVAKALVLHLGDSQQRAERRRDDAGGKR